MVIIGDSVVARDMACVIICHVEFVGLVACTFHIGPFEGRCSKTFRQRIVAHVMPLEVLLSLSIGPARVRVTGMF